MDTTKFDIYDFVGFVIPGAVVFLILSWFIKAFLAVSFSILSISDGVAVLVILVAGYFLGHIMHAIGKVLLGDYEIKRFKFWTEALDGSTNEYREHIVEALDQTFSLQPPFKKQKEYESLDTYKKRTNELFHLTRALLRKANMATNIDTLEAICNMYRGMYACAFVSAVICLLISLKQLVIILQLMPNQPPISGISPDWYKGFIAPNTDQFILGFTLTLLFVVSAYTLLRPAWRTYKSYYVNSLFTNFDLWSRKLTENHQEDKQEDKK